MHFNRSQSLLIFKCNRTEAPLAFYNPGVVIYPSYPPSTHILPVALLLPDAGIAQPCS